MFIRSALPKFNVIQQKNTRIGGYNKPGCANNVAGRGGYESLPGINFYGFAVRSKDYDDSMKTCFFRDYDVLEPAVETIKKNFPNGATILDYACSDGEEAVSILALLDGDEDNLYDIRGLDKSSSAIEAARNGSYIFSPDVEHDTFVFSDESYPMTEKEQVLRNKFLQIMQKGTPSSDGTFTYSLKDKYKKKIIFEPSEKGNIFKISKYNTERPVGAIFFRNAFYQAFKFVLPEWHSGSKYQAKPFVNDFVDKIYKKLAPGGIFVFGDCVEDERVKTLIIEHIDKKYNGAFVPLNHLDYKERAYCYPTVWMKVR